MEEIPQVDYHPFVDIGDGRPHSVIARTDPIIGESVDPIEKTWLYKPRLTNLAIAVELEPTVVQDGKREKVTGFHVATRTFERTVLDDDGKPTDEKEEVTVPVVGLVAQSPVNFFNQLRVIDASDGEINTLPLKVTRVGKKDVSYVFKTFENIKPDLSNLFDYIGELSYLGDQAEPLLEKLAEIEDDTEAVSAIGQVLLDIRIDELADDEAYDELFQQITEPSRFPAKSSTKTTKKTERPSRPSQRRAQAQPAADAPEGEAEKPVARTRTAEESATKATAREERLARLKARQAAAK
jgi:hypothetical protein